MVGFDIYGSPNSMLLDKSMINNKVLELAVPSNTTAQQWKEIQKAVEYAKTHNIPVNITKISGR